MKRQGPRLLLAGMSFLYAALLSSLTPALKAQGKPAPAAAEGDTAALAKATQNPVASLISVPLQNNSNFSVGDYDRTQNVLNIQPVIPARIQPIIHAHHSNYPADCVAAVCCSDHGWAVWHWRHESDLLPVSRKARQIDLGLRARDGLSHRDQHAYGTGQVKLWSVRSCSWCNRATGPSEH